MKIYFKHHNFILSGFALIVLTSCGSSDKNAAKTNQQATISQPAMEVDVMIVKSAAISHKIDVQGTLMPSESVEIHPEISGRLVQLNVAEGKFVSQGALLAKIYDGDLQAQLKKLEVQLEIAQKNEERSEQLLKIQGISKADYDASQLNVNNIKADIAITKANITKTEIRAPFSGKLGLRNISPGAFVTTATIITTINQVNQLKIQFSVPEKYSRNKKSTNHSIYR